MNVSFPFNQLYNIGERIHFLRQDILGRISVVYWILPYVLFSINRPFTNSPSIWNCTYSCCCIRTVVVECTCWGNTFYPTVKCPWWSVCEVASIAQCYRLVFKYPWIFSWIKVCCAGAVFACDVDADIFSWIIISKYKFSQNHTFSFRQCQVWPVARCQLAPCRCIRIKHTKHAGKGLQFWCICLYSWSLSQGCTVIEHAAVATISKCRCWQFWSGCQGCATVEHAFVAASSQCSSR